MEHRTEEFEEYLNDCYFHESRDKCYPSEQVKDAATVSAVVCVVSKNGIFLVA